MPSNFNPNTPGGYNFVTQQVMDQIWPQIFIIGGDNQTHLDTAVVSQAELISINPEIVTYQINPAAKWADGVPIRADDFVYNWHAHIGVGFDASLSPFLSVDQPGWSDINSVVGSSNDTLVTVTFGHPFADWESLFSNLIPAHVGQRLGWNHGFLTPSSSVEASSLQKKISSEVQNSSLVLVPNPNFSGPKPYISKLIFKVVEPGDQMVQALESGQMNFIMGQSYPSVIAGLSNDKYVKKQVSASSTYLDLVFNPLSSNLTSPIERRAIASIIDRQQLASDSAGYEIPSIGTLDNHFTVSGLPGYLGDAGLFGSPSIDQSQKLLSQAGFNTSINGVVSGVSRTPLNFNLIYDSTDQFQVQTAQLLQAQWRDAGIEISLNALNGSQAEVQAINSGTFQIALFSQRSSDFESRSSVPLTGGLSQATVGLGGNWPTPSGILIDPSLGLDPTAASLAALASSSLDTLKGRDYYQQSDLDLWNDAITIPLFQEPELFAWSANIANVMPSRSMFGPLWNANSWVELLPTSVNSSTTTSGG
ncbi:MAG: hypothetical protein HKL80_00160 [Acidimicrobiales bacterium]|nr:hypothetical protein [Acidimicrobiales bacterium]